MEREVVRNELRMRSENSFRAALPYVLPRTYPADHPYSTPGIGTHDSLDQITLADVQTFVEAHYRPEYATLVVAGDLGGRPASQWMLSTLSPSLLHPELTADHFRRRPSVAQPDPNDPSHRHDWPDDPAQPGTRLVLDLPAPPARVSGEAPPPPVSPATEPATHQAVVEDPLIVLSWTLPGGYRGQDSDLTRVGSLTGFALRDQLDPGRSRRVRTAGCFVQSEKLASTLYCVIELKPKGIGDRERIAAAALRAVVGSGGAWWVKYLLENRTEWVQRDILDLATSLENVASIFGGRATTLAHHAHYTSSGRYFSDLVSQLQDHEDQRILDLMARWVKRSRAVITHIDPAPPETRSLASEETRYHGAGTVQLPDHVPPPTPERVAKVTHVPHLVGLVDGRLENGLRVVVLPHASVPFVHATWYSRDLAPPSRPGNSVLVLVGDLDPRAATSAVLEYFGRLQPHPSARTLARPSLPPYTAPEVRDIIVLDDPASSQTQVSFRCTGAPPDDADRHAVYLAGGIVGEALRVALREESGATYGAGGRIARWEDGFSQLSLSTLVQNDAVPMAIHTMRALTERVEAEGIADADMLRAAWVRGRSMVLGQQTMAGMAGRLTNVVLYDRPWTDLTDRGAILGSVTGDHARRAMTGCSAHQVITLEGPIDVIGPLLTDAGLTWRAFDWERIGLETLAERSPALAKKAEKDREEREAARTAATPWRPTTRAARVSSLLRRFDRRAAAMVFKEVGGPTTVTKTPDRAAWKRHFSAFTQGMPSPPEKVEVRFGQGVNLLLYQSPRNYLQLVLAPADHEHPSAFRTEATSIRWVLSAELPPRLRAWVDAIRAHIPTLDGQDDYRELLAWAAEQPGISTRSATKDADAVVTSGDEEVIRLLEPCNAACDFCACIGVMPDYDHSVDEVRERVQAAVARGRRRVVFTGGEPTLLKHLPQLVALAKAEGMTWVNLQTNGIRLASRARVEALAEAGLDSVLMSIHSFRPAVHDAVVKVPGAFDNALRGLVNCIKAGIQVTLNYVVHRDNLEDTPGYIAFFHKNFLSRMPPNRRNHFNITLSFVSPIGWTLEHLDMIPRIDEAAPVIARALRIAEQLEVEAHVPGLCGIPLCTMPGWETHLDEYNATSPPPAIPARTYVPACDDCTWRPRCSGFWKVYLDRFGVEELGQHVERPWARKGKRARRTASPELLGAVRELAGVPLPDADIATALDARGLRTPAGLPWTARKVKVFRDDHKIEVIVPAGMRMEDPGGP